MEEFFGPEENMDEVGQELSGLVGSWQQGAGLIARFLVETVKRLSWMVQEHGKLYSDQIIRMQGLSDATNGQNRVPSQLQR